MSSWKTKPTEDFEDAARMGLCGGPYALVPGDALSMRAASTRFQAVARGSESVGALLRRVDAGEWWGESGDAFREVMAALPAPYALARAFGDAGRALGELADTVECGRATAEQRSGHRIQH